MAGDANLWDSQPSSTAEISTHLSRIVTGNDNLVTQPGLVQALLQNNATPQQAQALDQFVGGLEAEKMVRAAGQSGQKIKLSTSQQSALSNMGIDFSPVLYTQQNAVDDLTAQMAQKGLKPVKDEYGNVQTDENGNPLAEKIPQPKKSGGGGFWHAVGAPFRAVGSGLSDVWHGHLPGVTPLPGSQDNPLSPSHITTDIYEGYQWASSYVVDSGNPLAQANANAQNESTARDLGYDPGSFFSMQAFRAHGYAHRDDSALVDKWDAENPAGLNGWDGQQALTEAAVFSADPDKYVSDIVADTTLTPDQTAAKLKAVSSDQFTELVRRVNGSRADIGAATATSLGIDPVKHATTFNTVAAGTNLAAQFAVDPIAFGLGAYRNVQVSAAAISNFSDGASISRLLRPTEGAGTSVAQRRIILHLNDMVTKSNEFRAATDAGDAVKAAQVHAGLQTNPFAGLLGDFTGKDQIVGLKSEHAVLNSSKGDLPFVYGEAEPISTFDHAVDYLSSKSALLRLQGGYAPVEVSVMPGALSSYAFLKMKGGLSAWSAGRAAAKSVAAEDRFVSSAAADAAKLDRYKSAGLLTEKDLARVLPHEEDAVDMLTGRVLAETSQTEAGLASARRGDLSITDAGRGHLRGNKLRYGTYEAPETKVGRAAAIYTLGAAQRAKMMAARFSNWLPRSSEVDLTAASSADTVRRVARTYLTTGDSNLLAARWVTGNAETRKTIVSGLKDQIAHAAGLTRTQAGRDLVEGWHATDEKYLAFGDEFVDANGVAGAMYPGQVQTKFRLPEFGKVHQAAAKIGIYEGTIGRILTNGVSDRLMSQFKLQVLMSPVTAMRANIESWLNAHADGLFKSGVQAKAVLRDTGKLDGLDISRSRPTEAVLSLAPLQGAGRFYRHVAQTYMDEAEARAIAEMPDDLMHAYIHEQAAYHYAMNVDPGGTTEATQIASVGLRPVKVNYNTPEGFHAAVKTRLGYEVTDEVNGISGANLYAHNLALRVNKAPNVARAIIERLENPELGADHVVAALESGPSKTLMHHSMFGKAYRRTDGKQVQAVSADEIALGKQQWADVITEDFRKLVSSRNGNVEKRLTEHINAHGEAPDADWILDKLKGMDRPEAMLRPVISATTAEAGVKPLIDHIIDTEGRMYQWLVERLIQRHSTTPLFAAAYGKSKVGLEDFKQAMIHEGGLSEEAAERATSSIAAQQAWSRIAKMVDDPHLKSQMDVVGRSFFAFSRATTMMMRRWGSTLWRNPAQARKFQLAGEAAVHAGLVYQDETTGDWMFHFPASGVAQEVLMHAMSHIPGLDGLAQFPTSDFTGRVSSIIPGSSNPFQYSTSPMVSISGRWIAGRFPEYRSWFDEVDRALNGSQGQGQGVLASLEPTAVRRFTDPLGSDRDSLTTSAMVGSLYNLYAAGLVPPDGASPSEIETFLGRLKTQTKTQLYLRAVLGMFSPATIKVPENENDASKADFAYAIRGAQGLHDEFRTLLNDTGGDIARAASIWTSLHPDLTVYTASGSSASTSRAVMPATKSALSWMNSNLGFIDKYKSVAAFFIPEDSKADPFSMAAYRAQLEEGLRQRKTPAEFLEGVRISGAAGTYYAVDDKYKADLAAAKASGNDQLAAQHRADWLAWSKQFKALHPTFAIHTEGSAANVRIAEGKIQDLRAMVAHGDVPGGLGSTVSGMLQAYDGYRQFVRQHPGGTNQAKASRASAFSMFQDYLSQTVASTPQIADLYAGVFRVLDTQLEEPTN